MSELHSVIFHKTKSHNWTQAKAKKFLNEHKIKPIKKVHITYLKNGKINSLRYRIRPPEIFKKFITKKTDSDVSFVIGFYEE